MNVTSNLMLVLCFVAIFTHRWDMQGFSYKPSSTTFAFEIITFYAKFCGTTVTNHLAGMYIHIGTLTAIPAQVVPVSHEFLNISQILLVLIGNFINSDDLLINHLFGF